jgi:predicted phosphodiesterase
VKAQDRKYRTTCKPDIFINTGVNLISTRKILLLLIMAVLLLFSGCLNSGDDADISSSVTSLSPLGGPLQPKQADSLAIKEAVKDNFTVVVLPDTQYYSKDYPETYTAQANWIVQNASRENIKFVVHLGDFVQNSTSSQWDAADAAQDILDRGAIPYCATIGNHDYETDGDYKRDSTKFNQYFGVSRFNGKSYYGGGYPAGKNDNSYYFFESGDLDFLVISLEYAPRKDALEWAADIVKAYPDRRVVIVTHGYLYTSGDSLKHADLTTDYDSIGSDGTTLFNEFISRYSNIFMVIAGHNGGDCVRPVIANDGHTIYEVLVDYQFEPNGGNGWFKTFKFSPADGTILMTPHIVSTSVTAFSETGYYSSVPEDHIFEVPYDMNTMADFAEEIDPVGFNDRTMNAEGSGNQRLSRAATIDSGHSIVVWEDDADDDGKYNIKMRGFTPDGTENFGEMTINSNTGGTHSNPSVAVDSSGDAVVVWQDDSDGDGRYKIKMSGYTIDGNCRFSNYSVASDSLGRQANPAVSMDATGRFVVVWQEDIDNIDSSAIYMRGFDSNGLEFFSERTANSVPEGHKHNPDVEALSNGVFVVAWEGDQDRGGPPRVYMRGFNFSGTATESFAEEAVSTSDSGRQLDPAICKLTDGNFVVAWEDDGGRMGASEIYISGFDSTGLQYFRQKAAGSAGNAQQYNPAIASDEDGSFTVAWQDGRYGGYDIMIRAFDQTATEIMAQTRVNKDASGLQTDPDVALGSDGRIVVVWSDDTDANGYYEIVGRGAYDFNFESYYGD